MSDESKSSALSERLASYRTLRAGITPGPWRAIVWDDLVERAMPEALRGGFIAKTGSSNAGRHYVVPADPRLWESNGAEADARFIAAAPQIADDCLALAEENARLQAELARLEAIIAAWNGFADDLGTGILEALTPDAARLVSDGAPE